MALIDQIRLLERLDDLIRRKATGTPEDLARRLNLTRSRLYRRIDDLKSTGAPVNYCRFSKSFYYEEPFRLPFKAGKDGTP